MVQSPVRAESVDPERPQVDRTWVPGNKMRDELTSDGSSRQPQMVIRTRRIRAGRNASSDVVYES